MGNFGQHVAQGKLAFFEFEPARLNLSDIKDIVDESEEVFGGDLDLAQIIGLSRWRVQFEGEFGKSEDGGHGRPDFVAHVGQKIALGPGGGFGGLLGHLELASPVFFRKILEDAFDGGLLAGLFDDGVGLDADVDQSAVPVPGPGFEGMDAVHVQHGISQARPL